MNRASGCSRSNPEARPEKRQLACKPGSVHAGFRMGWPFIWNARYRALHATNPGGDLKTDPDRGLCRPYLVLLPVGFTAAATVAGRSVRSYRTVSPLLRQAGAVLSLWL